MVMRNERGALTVPMSLAVLIIAGSALGLWGMLRHWRNLAETQLRLDRCAGKTALELRDSLNSIESGNRRIRILRAAMLATAENPAAAAATQTVLRGIAAVQDLQRTKWNLSRIAWQSGLVCEGKGDLPRPAPAMNWIRDPADELGPKPLRWEGDWPNDFRIAVTHPPRAAGARVFRNPEKENVIDSPDARKWKTAWY